MSAASFPYFTSVEPQPETRYRTFAFAAFDAPFLNEQSSYPVEVANPDATDRGDVLPLSGFVFHSAHCGSTLLSRMLANSGAVRTVNETDAINGLLLSYLLYALDEGEVIQKLQKIVEDYLILPGNRRHAVFKLSSWNVFFLPLFRKAFPQVPWIYLHREEDALVNSLLHSGLGFATWFDFPTDFMVRAFIPKDIPLPTKEAYLRQMSRMQMEIAQGHRTQGGILLRYPEFLEEFKDSILPHFGIVLSDTEWEAAQEMRQYDAKSKEKMPYQAKS